MFIEIFSEDVCKLIRLLADKKKNGQIPTKETQPGLQRDTTLAS